MKTLDATELLTLKLPDGRNARDLDRYELARVLQSIGIDVAHDAGKQDSLIAYRDHCRAVAETERRLAR